MPFPSPTTTRSVKLKRRPPLTTLDTRLMVTTRSRNLSFSASRALSRPRPRPPRSPPPLRSPRRAPRRSSWPEAAVVSADPRQRSQLLQSPEFPFRCSQRSQCQPTFTCAVGNRCNAAVVPVAAAVEDHSLNTSSLGTLGHELADALCLGGLVAVEGPQIGFHGGSGRHGDALAVIDNLDKDVACGAVNHQARTDRGTGDALADAQMAAAACCGLGLRGPLLINADRHGLLTSLSDLAADLFAGVANALALVGVRLTQLADVGSNFADLLLVDAGDGELGSALHGEGDAVGGIHDHRVAEAQGELEVRSLGLHAVTGADDLEVLLVALGHAN